MIARLLALGVLIATTPPVAAQTSDAPALYQRHCAACHGAERFGETGPALLPDSLRQLRPASAKAVIEKGRPATQMPGFADGLSAAEISALAAFIYTNPPTPPRWELADIRASRTLTPPPPRDQPIFSADPLNLFVVVEAGDHHVTILDGDRFEPLTRFASRYALHGGPKFTPDGRYVFFGSRDGWVSKYDLWSLAPVGEIRVGINLRNIAISSDGRFVAAANMLPHRLVILDARTLEPVRVMETWDRERKASSRVSAVYQAPGRKSFVAAMKDIPEIWEIATDESAPPVYPGLVHSYEQGMVEGLASESGLFATRRIMVSRPIDDFFFDPSYRNLLGSRRGESGAGDGAVVVNLTTGREIATLPIQGLPHVGAGIAFRWQDRPVLAFPNLKEGRISIVDADNWALVTGVETLGPGFFMRSHEASRYAWTDAFLSKDKDKFMILDKETLEIVKVLQPMPGKTAAHVEFDRSGKHALLSIWEDPGMLIVYDAVTFNEVKRLPMRKPSGKYNVWNKIRFSDGTSH